METRIKEEENENEKLSELVRNLSIEVEKLKERVTHVEKGLIKQKNKQRWI